MNYEEALRYIEQLNTKGIALGLERITALLERLGNPQDALRCIHVAGTNGKGSVCAFIDSALQHAGLRVGRYSSPTLYRYLERFQINGLDMEPEIFAQLIDSVRIACVQMEQQGLEVPTVFEVETAIAFLYFKQQACDYVLLEVGMGGRLDSTNVIHHPVLSVITSISMDHTAMLGDTLAQIATEKAGIIKTGCMAVVAPQEAEAMCVLEQVCMRCQVTPVIVNMSDCTLHAWDMDGQTFDYGNWQNVTIGLVGEYQRINAAVALEALQLLQQLEPTLDDVAIIHGLAQAKWSGRFEVIGQKPLFIVDGAHNPAGAQGLADTVRRMLADRQVKPNNVWLLMGVFADKAYTTIGRMMSSCGDTLITFCPPGERGLPSALLSEAMQPYYPNIIDMQTPEHAVQYVLEHAADTDMIISFGSLSTIKAVQDTVKKREVPHVS